MVEPSLRLRLLGGCDIASAGAPVHLESSKTTALLALLALSPGPQPRSRLMGLLWPELAEERSAGNLRRAVWDLRRKLGDGRSAPHPLRTSRVELELARDESVDLDVACFERSVRLLRDASRGGELALSGRELAEVEEGIELYRGDLLAGLAVPAALELEEWLLAERERLRRLAEQGFGRLVEMQRARGDLASALAHARRLLALDPWREEVHRTVMELLAAAGEPAAALAQFESCRRLLAEQLQTAPSAETVRLVERIRRASPAIAPAGAALEPPLPPRHNLPSPGTPFVGRERELAAALAELARSGCRLLSLVGPGGIGKTRLALRLGQALVATPATAALFPDGVLFVGPRESGARGALAVGIAEALGVAPREAGDGAGDLEATLLAAARERGALLLLDGLEHLRGEVAWLSTLLAAAPELKVVATTRERLQLPEEWVFELEGLALPVASELDAAAVHLFLQTARRARFGWNPSAADLALVAGICRRLEGLPLGIELAAGWVGSLSVAEIAAEIARDPGGLDPPASGPGQVRRGLRSVFTASWNRLPEEERRVFAALSVFVGGFTREAGEAVAGARLTTLRSLVDRSLLRYDPVGRYHLHEALRRFAGEELARDAPELHRVEERHALHVAARLTELAARLWAGAQRHAIAGIDAELENARAAWSWGVAERRTDVLAGCLDALTALAAMRGWPREAEAMLNAALAALEGAGGAGEVEARLALAGRLRAARGGLRNRMGEIRRARADLLAGRRALRRGPHRLACAVALYHLGEADYLAGRYPRSHRLFSGALTAARAAGSLKLEADALGRLGRIALEQGRHAAAEEAFSGSLAAARRADDELAELFALHQLGYMAYFRGELALAESRFDEALRRARETGDREGASAASTGLAFVAEDAGEFGRARGHYEAGVALARELGDRRGEAYALMLVGESERRQGAGAEARRIYLQAREIAGAIGSQYLLGLLAGNLAYVAAVAGETAEARRRIAETLAIYRTTGALTIALPALVAAADLEQEAGRIDRALGLLGLVLHHPANRRDHQLEVERVLAALRSRVPEERLATGLAAGQSLGWEATIGELEAAGGAIPSPAGRERAVRPAAGAIGPGPITGSPEGGGLFRKRR